MHKIPECHIADISSSISHILAGNLFNNLELLQILKVLAGYKFSTRLIFSSHEKAEAAIQYLKDAGLICKLISSDGYISIADRNKGGWANRCSSSKTRMEYIVYAGRKENAPTFAMYSEADGDNFAFGCNLSYPDCCCRFFEEEYPQADGIQGDLFPFVFADTRESISPFPYILNPLWYFDAGYLEYWPCSFRCGAALQDAAIGRMLLKRYLPEVANEMDGILKNPILYTEYSGIFVFKNSSYDETSRTLHYSPSDIKGTAKTSLFRILLQGNALKYSGGAWNVIQGREFIRRLKYQKLCLALFTDETIPELNDTRLKLSRFRAMNLPLPATTVLEFAMLLDGKKKAMRLIFPPEAIDEIPKLADELGLAYVISPLRATVVSSQATGDQYIDYIDTDDALAGYLVGFSPDTEMAQRCIDLEAGTSENSKMELNQLLNYPACCVENFLHRVPHEDWLRAFLKNTPVLNKYPCWTNRIGYLFSGKMLLYDYEPCSGICAESIRLGKEIQITLRRNHMEWLLNEFLRDALIPIFLVDGVLVKMHGCEVLERDEYLELCYNPSCFELKDYHLSPEAENSMFWDSNRMIVKGMRLMLYRDAEKIAEFKQEQYHHRIFIFEE